MPFVKSLHTIFCLLVIWKKKIFFICTCISAGVGVGRGQRDNERHVRKDQTALLCGQQQEASGLKSCFQQNYGISWEVSTKILGEEIS